MKHFILLYHGHVKIRFRPIAKELGVEIRTLERAFIEEFGKSMFQSQVDARLAFAQTLLRWMPPPKVSVVANMLGYDETRDFHHFFERHTGETPSAWGRKERDRAKREGRLAAGGQEEF
jgi:transcriptional regulator GlxA family with amidase domain